MNGQNLCPPTDLKQWVEEDEALFFFFKWWGVALLPSMGCSGTIITDCFLELLGSSSPPASAFRVARTAGTNEALL